MRDCIVIIGPTASGKTELSISIASKIGGEIISADSRQIYIGMDIGTAKPTKRQQELIPHYLIDIITPDKNYSAKEFATAAENTIKNIKKRNKVPLIVGGTGLYIKALFEGIFEHPPIPHTIRKRLNQEFTKKGLKPLYKRLQKIDKLSAERISQNDKQRIIRALEVYEFTGKPISQLQKEKKSPLLNPIYIGIYIPREQLKNRIKNRIYKMFKDGFIEEVEDLLYKGYRCSFPGFSSIGYKEVCEMIQGNLGKEDCIKKIIKHTVQYAKRQMTWFRKISNVNWVQNSQSAYSLINKAL